MVLPLNWLLENVVNVETMDALDFHAIIEMRGDLIVVMTTGMATETGAATEVANVVTEIVHGEIAVETTEIQE